jgi:YegS/Rv2252/BmrU family lipid kinase
MIATRSEPTAGHNELAKDGVEADRRLVSEFSSLNFEQPLPRRTALLLVNQHSRQGEADLAPALELLSDSGIALVRAARGEPRSPAQLIADYREQVDLFIVGGGDGTLNRVADALVEAGLPLGILPLGTANDLARTLDLPSDLAGAGGVIARGRTRQIDLGRVNGKHFFNVASLGLSTRVTETLTKETKRRWGVLGYPLSLWRAARGMRSFRVDIRCDEVEARLHSMQLWIGNGRHFGGGMTIAANADIDDGKLDLVSLGPRSLWQLILSSPALRWGHHDTVERLRHWRGTEIEIDTHRRMPINTDGELTTHTPARFTVVPTALSVFVP